MLLSLSVFCVCVNVLVSVGVLCFCVHIFYAYLCVCVWWCIYILYEVLVCALCNSLKFFTNHFPHFNLFLCYERV